jgi:hypothetical protein
LPQGKREIQKSLLFAQKAAPSQEVELWPRKQNLVDARRWALRAIAASVMGSSLNPKSVQRKRSETYFETG